MYKKCYKSIKYTASNLLYEYNSIEDEEKEMMDKKYDQSNLFIKA